MDINVNIKCEDLALSISALARTIGCLAPTTFRAEKDIDPVGPIGDSGAAETVRPAPTPFEVNPTPARYSPATPAPTPQSAPTSATAPVSPMSAPALTTPAAATIAPTAPTAVPTSPAPQITGDMVAKAGADLIAVNPAAMGPLNALLQKYGVGCAQELRPDQIGPFATEMRALGARL